MFNERVTEILTLAEGDTTAHKLVSEVASSITRYHETVTVMGSTLQSQRGFAN